MSNNSIVDKIEFAIKYKVPCEVYYKNSYRPWKINIYAFDDGQIQWSSAKKENPETFQMLINIHSKTKSVYDAKSLQKNIQKCWNRKKNGIANTGK